MYIYRLVLLLVVGIYLFSPAIMDWWIDPNGAWYAPVPAVADPHRGHFHPAEPARC
ncbi:hypothetical protein ACPA9J_21050 [Pseudomonas aeruginosa]